jgi:hypothetical protein
MFSVTDVIMITCQAWEGEGAMSCDGACWLASRAPVIPGHDRGITKGQEGMLNHPHEKLGSR